jgi:hypothetical protein
VDLDLGRPVPTGVLSTETIGPPRFLGEPLCKHALLLDPGGLGSARPLKRPSAAFRGYDDVGSPIQALSGLTHTACSLAVYAS